MYAERQIKKLRNPARANPFASCKSMVSESHYVFEVPVVSQEW